jgi:hypothetical protein
MRIKSSEERLRRDERVLQPSDNEAWSRSDNERLSRGEKA